MMQNWPLNATRGVLSDEMITEIGALGFARASFGVQEFDHRVQKAINRIQPVDMVGRCDGKAAPRWCGQCEFRLDLRLAFSNR